MRPERLRAWEARYELLEPSRSSGNFRLYSREDEARVHLMQRHLARGIAANEAAQLARNGIVEPSPARMAPSIPRRVARRSFALLRRALHDFDEAAAQQALDDLFRAFTIEAVLRDAVVPFLREIGEAWAGERVTPGQEHFVSGLIQTRLATLAHGWGTGTGPRALLACAPGEQHMLGLMVFGIALSRRRWRITFLGGDVPVDALAHAADRIRPELIVLAATQERFFDHAAAGLGEVAASHRLALAGAGASAATATRIGAEIILGDPVAAAGDLQLGRDRRARARA